MLHIHIIAANYVNYMEYTNTVWAKRRASEY